MNGVLGTTKQAVVRFIYPAAFMGMSGMKVMAYGHASNNIPCAQATKEMDPAFLWA